MKAYFYFKLVLFLTPVLIVTGVAYFFYLMPVITVPSGMTFYLKPATSKKVIAAELKEAGVIPVSSVFALYVYAHKNIELKTGEYRFPNGATQAAIWKQITTGTGLVYHPFTIIPGWSFTQLRQALAQTDGLRHLTVQMDDRQIMSLLGHQDLAPEGEFFPETYYYTKGIADLVLLKRAFDLMQSRLQEAWDQRATNIPYQNAYQALIAASLIEKEAYLDTERPIISGVIVNRLSKNMPLQIDATVIYGMGINYTGKIYKTDLLQDTPSNTYVHKGLPPTPIAAPGMISIKAAMHPETHDYLYYVAKGDGSGGHQFSKTLDEHNKAVTVLIKHETVTISTPKVSPASVTHKSTPAGT